MKRIIFLLFVMLTVMGVDAQQYYGRVSDSDGYTNIRRGPSTSYPIVRNYTSGDYLYYTPDKNGWCKVYSSNKSSSFMGYMHGSHIVKVNPNGRSSSSSSSTMKYGRVYDPKDNYVNIRRSPSTSAAICRRYNTGDYLYYIPQSNGWSKVYSGKSTKTFMGYMHTSRIVPEN